MVEVASHCQTSSVSVRPSRRNRQTRWINTNYLPREADFAENVAGLSDALLQVLALTAAGYLNKQIAWVRGSAEATVKGQQQEILRRLGLRSRTQAAVQFAVYCERLRSAGHDEQAARILDIFDSADRSSQQTERRERDYA